MMPLPSALADAKWSDAPAPGLYPGVPYDVYSRWAAINHSILVHFDQSPAHARNAMLNPSDPTEDMALGLAGHVAVLEPDRFDREFVAAPRFDKRTTKGKAGWLTFQEAHAGYTVILAEEYDLCRKMREAVWAHPTARELLQGPGANEVSAVWLDPELQVLCKGRLDRLCMLAGWSVVVDLKTTRNASRKSFERDVYNYKYYQQAAFYLDGLDALSPLPRKFMFLAVEKDPPYGVAIHQLDDDAIDLGRQDYRKNLGQYAQCLESGSWPGYGDGADLVGVPAWAYRSIEG